MDIEPGEFHLPQYFRFLRSVTLHDSDFFDIAYTPGHGKSLRVGREGHGWNPTRLDFIRLD